MAIFKPSSLEELLQPRLLPCLSLPFSGTRLLPLKIEARKHAPRTESAKVRNLRSRKLLTGTSERPRLLVFCSDKHLYVQVIDDTNKRTLLSASTSQKHVIAVKEQSDHPVVDAAKKIGEEVAKECFRQGITKVILYRRGSLHRQRMKAFRLAAQDQGLEIQFAK